jgi:hypothetical protein
MRSKALAILVCGLALGLSLPAGADPIYRWVDAQGTVNYGSKPPESGPSSKTVRVIQAEPAVVVHESAEEKAARAQRLRTAQADEEAWLRRRLIEQQIDAERARAELLRSQAAQSALSPGCGASGVDCDDTGYVVGWGRRGYRPSVAYPPRARPAPPRSTPSQVVVVSAHPRAF